MVKDMTTTPKGTIVSSLRSLWLRSRERATALQVGGRMCCVCSVKMSVAKGREQKIQVHHKDGVLNWDAIIAVIREQLLCDVSKLECLCPAHHDKVAE